MAGQVSKEPKEAVATPSDVPGGFPETPANEVDQPIAVNPLPAAAGAVNPIKLEPGQKIPESVTAYNINDNIKLDKESYEKSDTIPGLPTDLTTSKNIIPESGLPITDSTINSVGPNSTTAALAGAVPLEPKVEVPAVVKHSQEKAGVDPEASAVPEEVKEKAEVEEELKEKVPEAPSTSEGTAGVGTEKSEKTLAATAAATAATAGAAVVAAAVAAKDTVAEKATPIFSQATSSSIYAANQTLPDSLKSQLPVSTQETLATQKQEEKRQDISPEVPTEVKQSITEAGESPEAAANTAAVKDKKVVEAELLKEVKPVPSADETKGKELGSDRTVTDVAKTDAPRAQAPISDAPTADAPRAVAPIAEVPQAEGPKSAEPAASAASAASGANGANGAGSKSTTTEPSASKATETTPGSQKKRNRLSTILSKIKHKLSDK